jgi:hypothetical protein
MFGLLEWILILVQIVPYIITLASIITALTPTPKDDLLVGKAYRLLEYCALVIGKAKEIAPEKEVKDSK